MQNILEHKYQFGEQIFFRECPSITLFRVTSKQDNKSFLLKIWKIHNENSRIFQYPQRFNQQNIILRQRPPQLSKYFPKLIQFGSQVKITQKCEQLVSYQLFENVKFDNIFKYHDRRRMIPLQVAFHIFKEIVTAVKLFHAEGKTFYSLDPTYIMLDQNVNPIFMDLSSSRKLSHAQKTSIIDTYHLSNSFKAPQTYLKNQTFNLAKSDSFQLGILLNYLALTGSSPFVTTTDKDQIYRFIIRQEFQKFFTICKVQKADKQLKELIIMLIKNKQISRLDVQGIQNTSWWKSTSISNPVQQFQVFVKKINQFQQQQFELAEKKVKSFIQTTSSSANSSLSIQTKSVRSSLEQSYHNFSRIEFKGNDFTNCYFWTRPFCQTFSTLSNLANNHFDVIQRSVNFKLICIRYQQIRLSISVYYHPTCPQVTIVHYQLLDEDVFYLNDRFQNIIQSFQSAKQNNN